MPSSQAPGRGTTSFILITAFLNLAGIGIVIPVLNFLVGRYVQETDAQTWAVSLIFASYSFFQFIATPTLGVLSDRYGRRPLLLICLFGSALGYLIAGVGGALWLLFLGRIIDGITGGNIGIIYAYAADITTPADRTRFFGLLGAAAGMGFVIGPVLGGALYSATGLLEAPFYAAAAMTLINVVWGWFAMPESLPVERRSVGVKLSTMNPFTQLVGVFRLRQIRVLLIGILLWTISLAVVQSNIAYLTEDQLGWTPTDTNLLFVLIGLIQVVTQGVLIRRLADRFGEGRLAVAGSLIFGFGLLLIGVTTLTGFAPLVFVSVLFTSFGNGLIIPTSNALISGSVGVREQGQAQGGNQAVQALGRVLGPFYGGATYTLLSPASTYVGAALIMGVTAGMFAGAVRALTAHRAGEKAAVAAVGVE